MTKAKISPGRLSRLADLRITASEKEMIARQLQETVNFFTILNKVKGLDRLEPTFQVTKNENVVREDTAKRPLPRKSILSGRDYFETKGGIFKK